MYAHAYVHLKHTTSRSSEALRLLRWTASRGGPWCQDFDFHRPMGEAERRGSHRHADEGGEDFEGSCGRRWKRGINMV